MYSPGIEKQGKETLEKRRSWNTPLQKEIKRPGRPTNPKKPPMKNITINIPEVYVEKIEKCITENVIPSRSEFIRNAIGDLLSKDLKFQATLKGDDN